MALGAPRTDIVSGGGISPGTPFTLGNIPVVSQTIPPFVVDSLLRQASSANIALGVVVGATDVPYGSGTNIAETLRTVGGAIFSSGGSSYATKIGRGASFTAGTDAGNSAANSNGIVIGSGARANCNQANALGPQSFAQGQGDVAIGYQATASGNGNGMVAIGPATTASGGIGVAIGSSCFTSGFGVTIGFSNTSVTSATCIGSNITAYDSAVVLNPGSTTNASQGRGDVVIGADSRSYASSFSYTEANVCIGYQSGNRNNSGTSRGNVHIGTLASSTQAAAKFCVTIGNGATTAFDGTIVIGKDMSATAAQEIAIGINEATFGPATSLRLGGPDVDTVARNFAIRFINATGTNVNAGTLTITAPLSTGTGTNADLVLRTGILQSSGSTLQSAGDRLRIWGGRANTHVHVIGPNVGSDATHGYWPNGGATERATVGSPGTAGNLVTGSVVGDLVLRTLATKSTFSNDNGTTVHAQIDSGSGADTTPLLLWDVSAATLKRVTRGAVDSGGAGFRLLRIAN